MQKDYFKNALSSPETYFSDQFVKAITQNSRLADVIPTEKEMETVDMNRMMEIYNDRFSDASDFTFFIVGAFKVDSVKPFIEKYLASLPATRRQESWKDMGIRPPSKKTDVPVYKGNDPKSLLGIYFEMPIEWNIKANYDFESLGQLLMVRYLDVIREELSGAYTMRSAGNVFKVPYSRYTLNVVIPCSPDNIATITKAALNEIKTIQTTGVKPEDLAKIKEAQKRDLEKNLKENSFWLSELMKGYRYENPELITEYEKWIRELSAEEIQAAANHINLKNYVRVVLYPEKPIK
jgi:zinc protease